MAARKKKRAPKRRTSTSAEPARRRSKPHSIAATRAGETADGVPLFQGAIVHGNGELDLGVVACKTEKQAVQKFRKIGRKLV